MYHLADVLVLDKAIVGWEASGRNGGGATRVHSPFGLDEQRPWPQMDELLGHLTEYQPHRIGVTLSETQLALTPAPPRSARLAASGGSCSAAGSSTTSCPSSETTPSAARP